MVKVQSSVTSLFSQLVYHYRRGKGHIFRYILNRFRWNYYPLLRIVTRYPEHVDIEAATVCNMKCPMCYTTTARFKRDVFQGLMDINLYRKIIDEIAGKVYSIRLSLRGEPLLNKNLIEMIKYAKDSGIREVSFLTNNLRLTPEIFEQVMLAGLDWLTISFDGLNETYEKIRYPAKFEDSLMKIKKYKEIKDAHNNQKPVIRIQSVHPAVEGCEEDFFNTFKDYVDDVSINYLADYLDKDEDIEYVENFKCPSIYQRLVVGADGRVLLCSNDEFSSHIIGDINEKTVFEIWHGKEMRKVRRLHRSGVAVSQIEICKKCHLPRKREKIVSKIGDRQVTLDKFTKRIQKVGE